jgi:site-specific DNA-methyltransferase (adenine-specific)
MTDDRWLLGGGFSKPGLGERPTEWPSFGGREATPNPTCAACGGRLRGARKCSCETPDWRVKGEPDELGSPRSAERGAEGDMPEVAWPTERAAVVLADCVDVMRAMEPHSVDAIVCDPPYGLEFMGKEWDRLESGAGDKRGIVDAVEWAGGEESSPYSRARVRWQHGSAGPRAMQEWHYVWAVEALRVLKPGGYLLAFGGTRTYHRLACAVEDAGFEIKDSKVWLYGQGFPKSLNVSRAIDKTLAPDAGGGEGRDELGVGDIDPETGGTILEVDERKHEPGNTLSGAGDARPVRRFVTEPVTEEAKKWQGWGTALKPAHEPICLARKPLIGSVVRNVLEHGTGALNVDGCRVGWGEEGDLSEERREAGYSEEAKKALGGTAAAENESGFTGEVEGADSSLGRWPANVLMTHHPDCRQVGAKVVRGDGHFPRASTPSMFQARGHRDGDERSLLEDTVPEYECVEGCPVRELDEQSGQSRSAGGQIGKTSDQGGDVYEGGWAHAERGDPGYGDEGGASRFFATFEGCGAESIGAEPTCAPIEPDSQSRFLYAAKADPFERNAGLDDFEERPVLWSSGEQNPGSFQSEGSRRAARNDHPTVKPINVMRWLVRLVTPPGGLVLDPFMGSGTTGIACALEGFRFLGVERDEHFAEIAAARIAYWDRMREIAAGRREDDVDAFARRAAAVRARVAEGQLTLLTG